MVHVDNFDVRNLAVGGLQKFDDDWNVIVDHVGS